MQIEAGKYYIDGRGVVQGPMSRITERDDDDLCWMTGNGIKFYDDGKSRRRGSERDLVQEVYPMKKPSSEATDSIVLPRQIEAGAYYLRKNSIAVGPLNIIPPKSRKFDDGGRFCDHQGNVYDDQGRRPGCYPDSDYDLTDRVYFAREYDFPELADDFSYASEADAYLIEAITQKGGVFIDDNCELLAISVPKLIAFLNEMAGAKSIAKWDSDRFEELLQARANEHGARVKVLITRYDIDDPKKIWDKTEIDCFPDMAAADKHLKAYQRPEDPAPEKPFGSSVVEATEEQHNDIAKALGISPDMLGRVWLWPNADHDGMEVADVDLGRVKTEPQKCTCHPDDRVEPCAEKFAAGECQKADERRKVLEELKAAPDRSKEPPKADDPRAKAYSDARKKAIEVIKRYEVTRLLDKAILDMIYGAVIDKPHSPIPREQELLDRLTRRVAPTPLDGLLASMEHYYRGKPKNDFDRLSDIFDKIAPRAKWRFVHDGPNGSDLVIDYATDEQFNEISRRTYESLGFYASRGKPRPHIGKDFDEQTRMAARELDAALKRFAPEADIIYDASPTEQVIISNVTDHQFHQLRPYVQDRYGIRPTLGKANTNS